MINIFELKAGRIATILLEGEYKLNAGGRSGIPLNIYKGRVTRKFRFSLTLAGEETYNNIYPESIGKPNWFTFVRDGLVRNNKTGQLYVAGIPHDNPNSEFGLYVDGRRITQEEYDYIQQYRPDSKDPKFLTISLDNVVNLQK
jgi:hypothetical protein